ncbi:ATP-binding protein [Demequina sp. NBRC 110054]|uniref:ATP-binding protein n=1 Tax=Demequina sp. NBRC 110054 TaxID=1570343 RepID=UPI000A03193C|nr:ATP-binding protein [Demequina sp. NBRC 110054]
MKTRSISGRLSATLAALTLVVACVAGAWSYRAAYVGAKSLQDDVLTQVATLAANAAASGTTSSLTTDSPAASDPTTDIDIATLEQAGLDDSTQPGLTTTVIDGIEERLAVARVGDGPAMVAAQPVAARDDLAREAAASAVVPFLILIPLLMIGLVLATRRALAPVRALADEVASADGTLPRLDADRAPRELQGFISTLNTQRERVEETVAHERLFIMQAAHELRLPLTAVSLQLERAALAPDDARLRDRLEDLRGGVDRSRHVVEQLLALARARSTPEDEAPAEGFATVLRAVLAEVLPAADRAGVEIEVTAGGDDASQVPATAATSAIRNVLDNAIRHGGSGGRVAVAASREGATLVVTVDDAGPGIDDPEAVMRPFARGRSPEAEGSGLGLTIVAEQMRRIRGTAALEPTPLFPSGTRVRLSFPVVPTSPDTAGREATG